MGNTRKKRAVLEITSNSESIKALWLTMRFQPTWIERFLFKYWVVWLPVPLIVLVGAIYWFSPPGYPSRLQQAFSFLEDSFLFTLVVAAFLAALSTALWESTIRNTFSLALESGFIRNDETGRSTFANLSLEFIRIMHSGWRIVCGLSAVVLAVVPNYEFFKFAVHEFATWIHVLPVHSDYEWQVTDLLSILIDGTMLTIIIGFAFVGGLLLWSLIAGAIWISKLSQSTALRLQPGHSDNCCGLAQIGMCCLQNALPLLIGMMLCLLWSQGSAIPLFLSHAPKLYIDRIQPYAYFFVFLQFLLAGICVYRPIWHLHCTLDKFKRLRDSQFSNLLLEQEGFSTEAMNSNDPIQLKAASDRLTLTRSFDPTALRLSSWPFDRTAIVSFGITPVLGVITTIFKLFGHK